MVSMVRTLGQAAGGNTHKLITALGLSPCRTRGTGMAPELKAGMPPVTALTTPGALFLQTEWAQPAVPSSLRQLLLSGHRRRSRGNCPVRSFLQHT